MKYTIDLPNPHDPHGPWVHYGSYPNKEAAVQEAQSWFGADEEGRLGVISQLPGEQLDLVKGEPEDTKQLPLALSED
jgi:hypothetical protein